MTWIMGILIWLVTGSVSFELVKTGHWISGLILILILLAATSVRQEG
jgi:hypothetical protein